MYLPTAIATEYESQFDVARLLKSEVDSLTSKRPQSWHYTSRIKSRESFLQKIETGRVDDPSALEDFFACTIVVPVAAELTEAFQFVEGFFHEMDRRPPAGPTDKRPNDFRFDDIRLYGTLKPPVTLPEGPIHGMRFEIQIKTLLAFAWGITTHDTVYKGARANWARERVGYQLKAMLEHVELVAGCIDALDEASGLPAASDDARLGKLLQFVSDSWIDDFRPPDLKRAATSIDQLAGSFKVPRDDFAAAFIDEFSSNPPPLGASPVAFALMVLNRRWPELFATSLAKERMANYRWLWEQIQEFQP